SRARPPGSEHNHPAAGTKQFRAQGTDVSPQAAGNSSLKADRGAVRETENHGAVSEPDLFRRRTLWRGSGLARLLRKTSQGHDAFGMRHARRVNQKSE